nr:uncharacterized protein LOC116281424 [Vicugna pacos]
MPGILPGRWLPRHASSLWPGREAAPARASPRTTARLSCSVAQRLLEARGRGAGTRIRSTRPAPLSRQRGCGGRTPREPAAARLLLRLRQPHVAGRGRSAFQEPGSAAARAPRRPRAPCEPRPAVSAARPQLLSMLGCPAAPTGALPAATSLPDLRKGDGRSGQRVRFSGDGRLSESRECCLFVNWKPKSFLQDLVKGKCW